MGANAFGITAPMGIENIVKGLGAGQDPLNQRASTGWKAFFTAVILQQLLHRWGRQDDTSQKQSRHAPALCEAMSFSELSLANVCT
jgi:hypothetical protein